MSDHREHRSRYVRSSPSRKIICGFQPQSFIRRVSRSLRGVPSGLLESKINLHLQSTVCRMSSATSLIVESSPQPILTIGGLAGSSNNPANFSLDSDIRTIHALAASSL